MQALPVQRPWERPITWGEALRTEIEHRPGLARIVRSVRAELGPVIGTRTTFAKLFEVERPEDLDESEQFRAWLVLTSVGFRPRDWGIDPAPAVPPGYNRKRLELVLPLLRGGGPAAMDLRSQVTGEYDGLRLVTAA
jgi:hypothetical protein